MLLSTRKEIILIVRMSKHLKREKGKRPKAIREQPKHECVTAKSNDINKDRNQT